VLYLSNRNRAVLRPSSCPAAADVSASSLLRRDMAPVHGNPMEEKGEPAMHIRASSMLDTCTHLGAGNAYPRPTIVTRERTQKRPEARVCRGHDLTLVANN
jgi:hypothetical protein